jgi:NADH dehydrogenase
VGGGSSGIETIGALNDFIRETTKVFYKGINTKDVRVLLINGDDKILDEVGDELGKFTETTAIMPITEKIVSFFLEIGKVRTPSI